YGSGFNLTGYTTEGNPVRTNQFSVVQANWSRIGVHLQTNYVPASKLFGGWEDGGILDHGAFQVSMYADIGFPDPDGFKFNFQHQYIDREVQQHSATLNMNVSGIKDAAFDKEFNKAASTFDNATRKKYYVEWQVGLNKKAYWVPLFYRGEITTEDGRIGNFKPNPTNAGNQWNVFEWYVKGKA